MQTWHVQVRRISVRGILMVIAAAAHCKPLESHLVGVTLYDSTSLSYPIKTLSWYTLSITVQALLQDRIAQPGSVSISQSDTLRPLSQLRVRILKALANGGCITRVSLSTYDMSFIDPF
mmetsp:Transcript_7038/g.14756  ORF Transcript_7038/g.14756 Transcript_7038/m.14756 type:complete len:119 (+) Transcript_7038:54-410(+)